MSGQTSRTVTLTLDTQTTGTDGVKALANELHKLGREGGDAAPEFERLSKELDSLAKQQDVAGAFKEVSAAVSVAKGELDAARLAVRGQADEVGRLRGTLDAAKTAEQQYAVGVREAQEALQLSNAELLRAKAGLSAYVAEIGGAKSATRDQRAVLVLLQQAVRDLSANYTGAKAALAALTPEHDRLKESVRDSADSVRQQNAELSKVTATANKAQTTYEELETTLKQLSQHMDKLGVDTKDVAGAQDKLAQSTARLIAEADQLKIKMAAPGAAAQTAAQRIEQAFGVIGVKSVAAAKAEILKINSALMTLAADANVTGADFDRAFTAGKAKIAALEAQLRSAEGTAKGFGSELAGAFRQFGPATLVFNGVTAAINALTGAASRIPQVTAEFQTMNRTLRILTGSTSAAAKEFEYIKGVANRVGSDIKGVGDAYIRLSAATKDTALAGTETRRIFEAVSGSMGVLGASSAETENALMAVTQMVSKGVVSMEEMRQQLGERLPGAFQVTAQQLGITTAELNDLISSGKLTAEQVLPALARGLEEVYKSGQQNDTLIGKWRQFTNALKESANAVGDSGLLDGLLKAGRIGTAAVQGLAEDFVLLGKSIGITTAGIVSGDLKGAMSQISDEFDAVNARIAKTAGVGQQAQKSLGDMAKEAKAAGQEFVTMADGTKYAVSAIEGASNGMVAFLVQSTKAEKQAETLATVQRKLAEYTRSSGEASITAANALGDEIDKRNTATKVAEANRAALESLLVAEKAVLAVLEERAQKRVEDIAAKGTASDADRKMLEDLDKELIERKAVVEGISQQVEANRVLAESLSLQAETTADNSTRMRELRVANEQFAEALKVVRAEVEAGRLSQEQLNVVEEDARKTKRLLLDALDDQIKKSEAVKDAKLGEISVEQAGLRLAIEVQRSAQNVARARGDEAAAARAGNEIKRLEIQMSQLVAQAKEAEATASKLVAEAKIVELQTNGPMTAAKEAEIRALEASVKVKEIEAQIARETAKGLDELKWATLASADAAQSSAGSFGNMSGSLDNLASSANNARGALEQLNATPRPTPQGGPQRPRGDNTEGTMPGIGSSGSVVDDPDYDHSTFLSGRTGTAGARSGGSTSGMDILYRSGASVAEAQIAAKYFDELFRRRTQAGSEGVHTTEQNNRLIADSSRAAAEEAIALARNELATGQATNLGASLDDITQMKLAQLSARGGNFNDIQNTMVAAAREAMAQQQPTGGTVVNVNIAGRTTPVNVSSGKDASQLVNLFKQLQSDATRFS